MFTSSFATTMYTSSFEKIDKVLNKFEKLYFVNTFEISDDYGYEPTIYRPRK